MSRTARRTAAVLAAAASTLAITASGAAAAPGVGSAPGPHLHPNRSVHTTPIRASVRRAAPVAMAAGIGSVRVRVDSQGWKGTAYYTYLSQDTVRYIARNGPKAVEAACVLVALKAPVPGAACAIVMILWGDWFTSQIRQAASRGCVRIMTIKNSVLAWQRGGFWIPPTNLGSGWNFIGWTKAAITVVPNEGPGGWCREH